jgi:hypothetical protein
MIILKINAPTIVNPKSTAAKPNTLSECIPSLGFPNISLKFIYNFILEIKLFKVLLTYYYYNKMLIQFDREDSENLVVTFDNSESDAEQMQDFIAWLEASGLEFNKLKMKIPGVADKVTNLFVKKPVSQVQAPVVSKQVTQTPAPVVSKQVNQPPAPVVSKQVNLPPAPVASKQVTQPPAPVEEDSEDTETAHIVAKEVSSDSESDSESDDEPVSKTKKTTKRTTKSTK